jgi:TonB family protein
MRHFTSEASPSVRAQIRKPQPRRRKPLNARAVVLLTIDKETGKVTGAEMLQSTGNKLLDGSALEAYSRWRFDPSTVTVPQLKIPIAFANRPAPQPAKHTLPQPVILLIILVIAWATMGFLSRRKNVR